MPAAAAATVSGREAFMPRSRCSSGEGSEVSVRCRRRRRTSRKSIESWRSLPSVTAYQREVDTEAGTEVCGESRSTPVNFVDRSRRDLRRSASTSCRRPTTFHRSRTFAEFSRPGSTTLHAGISTGSTSRKAESGATCRALATVFRARVHRPRCPQGSSSERNTSAAPGADDHS